MYIGATDEKQEGLWQWVNGETWRYSNWDKGVPNGGRQQNFARLLRDGTWDDIGTDYRAEGFVCEWSD